MPIASFDQGQSTGRRQHARLSVSASAELRPRSLRKIKINVLDISVAGFRISTFSPIHVGEDVYLHLPGLAPLRGTVRWRSRDQFGAEFAQPLHPSVAEHLANRFK